MVAKNKVAGKQETRSLPLNQGADESEEFKETAMELKTTWGPKMRKQGNQRQDHYRSPIHHLMQMKTNQRS